jgi:hypothetical protein
MDTDSKRQKIKEDICTYLKDGLCKRDASLMAGISEDTYLRWYKEDADFADRVEASILAYKHSLIQIINTSVKSDGRLALEILRRRFPREWNIPQKIEHEGRITTDTKEIAAILQKVYDKYATGQEGINPDIS